LHCIQRPSCIKRSAIINKVRGNGLTSAKIRCAEYALRGGLRVSAYIKEFGHGEEYLEGGDITGTVIGMNRKGKAIVWVDDVFVGEVASERVVCLWPDRLIPIDEPVIRICPLCGKPDGEKNKDGCNCDFCDIVEKSTSTGIPLIDLYHDKIKEESWMPSYFSQNLIRQYLDWGAS
jgi:hypothetical protein